MLHVLKKYGLDSQQLKDISIKTYPFGKTILHEGDICDVLIIVVSGKAKVGKTAPNGKDLILCFYVEDGMIGDMELFSKTNIVSSSVTVIDELTCIVIPVEENKDYLMNSLEFVRIAANEMSRKLYTSAESVVENTLYTAEIRLCRYILSAQVKGTFRDIMKDVAYSVGISYRHLYRMMGKLCKEGILEKKESGYKILDLEGLKKKSEVATNI